MENRLSHLHVTFGKNEKNNIEHEKFKFTERCKESQVQNGLKHAISAFRKKETLALISLVRVCLLQTSPFSINDVVFFNKSLSSLSSPDLTEMSIDFQSFDKIRYY